MKGYQLTSGVVLITIGLFSLQTQLVSAGYSMSETCRYYSGYVADPTNCQDWGLCKGGKLIGTGSCNDGLLFDTKNGICNYADSVTCLSSTVDDICKNSQSPQIVPDPNNCNKYCYCDGNNSTQCAYCPLYQFYNPSTGSCVWNSTYSCPADSMCRLVPNNEIVADPKICGNFMSCVDGAGVSTACANNQYYDPQSGYCENANPCNNDGSNTGPPTVNAGPGVVSPLQSNASLCTNSNGTVAAPQFVTDGKSCMGYHVCNNTTMTGEWYKCPEGTHFDPKSQKCVTPYTVVCNYDRCGNINQQFVTSASSDDLTCKFYDVCINQTAQPGSTGKCPEGYGFFDEVAGNCTPIKPDYAICGGSGA